MKEVVSTIPTSVEIFDAQGFVIQADGEVAVLHQLMKRQHGIIRLGQSGSVLRGRVLSDTHLYNSFRHLGEMLLAIHGCWTNTSAHLGGRKNRESGEHSIRILLRAVSDQRMIRYEEGMTSLIFDNKSEPRPAPVPPPSECVIWKPCKASQASACFCKHSWIESINSAPSV